MSTMELLNLDDMVNDMILVRNEMMNNMKHWENANRTFIKILRSIPLGKGNLPEMTDEDAKQRLQRLIESLGSSYIEESLDGFKQPDINGSPIDSINRTEVGDELTFEAYTGDQDDRIEGDIISPQPVLPAISNDNGPVTDCGPPPPPPPLPTAGMPKKPPAKRTVYDPLYVEGQMKKQHIPSTPLVPPEKKLINELRSVLDVINDTKDKRKNQPTDTPTEAL
eukprot:gene14789-17483_t